MPSIEKGESENKYVSRCAPVVAKEKNIPYDEAVARCHGMYQQHKKKGTQYSISDFRNALNKKRCESCKSVSTESVKIEVPETKTTTTVTTTEIIEKKEVKASKEFEEGKYYPFIFDAQEITKPEETKDNKSIGFVESAISDNGYTMTIAVGNRFMKGIYVSSLELKRITQGFHNTLHDLNHMGSGYQIGFTIIPSDIAYVVGYQDNPKFDDSTGELKADLHIEKDSPKYNDWKNYINISAKIGRIPNVSMFVYGRVKYVSTKDLPEGTDFKSEGYNENDLIPVMTDVIPYMVSTVFRGTCSDKNGCGIKHNESNDNVNVKNENEKVK